MICEGVWHRDPYDSGFELWALSQALAIHLHAKEGHLLGCGQGLLKTAAAGIFTDEVGVHGAHMAFLMLPVALCEESHTLACTAQAGSSYNTR